MNRQQRDSKTIQGKTRAGELKRKQIIKFIRQYRTKKGFSPSYRDIAIAVGLASQSTIVMHLRILRDEGKVTWVPHLGRTLMLVDE